MVHQLAAQELEGRQRLPYREEEAGWSEEEAGYGEEEVGVAGLRATDSAC